jgi:hypothetical protein
MVKKRKSTKKKKKKSSKDSDLSAFDEIMGSSNSPLTQRMMDPKVKIG